jgi:hypothetical protein
MRISKLGLALASVLALGAIMASSAFATATTPAESFWYSGPSAAKATKLTSGTSKTATCGIKSAKMTLESLVAGIIPVKITATGVECVSSKIEQSGNMAIDSGKIKFTGVTIDEPSGCTIPSTLETNQLNTKLEEEGSTVYDLFEPASGTTFINIPLSGCALAPGGNVEGSVFGKASNATGTFVETQVLSFSSAINATAGGTLSFAGSSASLTGEVNNTLGAGTFWGAKSS